MRVALVTETWLPSTDGVVTRLTATARELVRLGHQVLVIAPRGADVYRRDVRFPGVTVRTVPTVGLRFIYGEQRWGLPSARVGRFLRQFSPDVVHVVNPTLLGIAGVVAARRQRRRWSPPTTPISPSTLCTTTSVGHARSSGPCFRRCTDAPR